MLPAQDSHFDNHWLTTCTTVLRSMKAESESHLCHSLAV